MMKCNALTENDDEQHESTSHKNHFALSVLPPQVPAQSGSAGPDTTKTCKKELISYIIICCDLHYIRNNNIKWSWLVTDL